MGARSETKNREHCAEGRCARIERGEREFLCAHREIFLEICLKLPEKLFEKYLITAHRIFAGKRQTLFEPYSNTFTQVSSLQSFYNVT